MAVILTALDVETRAVLRHLTDRDERTVDGTVFYTGQFEDWHLAIAEVGPGNASAAMIAERAIQHFRPSVAFFVGIAGGVKDVAIGDVVIATKLYGYESGKEDATGFKPRPEVQNSAHYIEQRGRALSKGDGWKRRLAKDIGHGAPNVFVGPIAAGEKVVASTRGPTAKFLRKHYSDTSAVEMEGRGFLGGVNINPMVLGGVVRGISDMLTGKSTTDKIGSQSRAADAASAAVFEILSSLPKPKPSPFLLEPPGP
jgi:nucleoside phosphorylase